MKRICISSLDELTMVCDNNFKRVAEGFEYQGKINKRNKKALICAFICIYLLNIQAKRNTAKIKKVERELDELKYKGEDKEA